MKEFCVDDGFLSLNVTLHAEFVPHRYIYPYDANETTLPLGTTSEHFRQTPESKRKSFPFAVLYICPANNLSVICRLIDSSLFSI